MFELVLASNHSLLLPIRMKKQTNSMYLMFVIITKYFYNVSALSELNISEIIWKISYSEPYDID